VHRYFLNVKVDDTLLEDPDGELHPDEASVRASIKDVVLDVLTRPYLYGDFSRWIGRDFVVTDENGLEVMRVAVKDVAPTVEIQDLATWVPPRQPS